MAVINSPKYNKRELEKTSNSHHNVFYKSVLPLRNELSDSLEASVKRLNLLQTSNWKTVGRPCKSVAAKNLSTTKPPFSALVSVWVIRISPICCQIKCPQSLFKWRKCSCRWLLALTQGVYWTRVIWWKSKSECCLHRFKQHGNAAFFGFAAFGLKGKLCGYHKGLCAIM